MALRRTVQLSFSVRPVLNCRGLLDILNLLLPSAPTGQRESDVDSTACLSIALSAGIIFTTIHTQDYRDAPGDAAGGRVTLPIAYPVLSRAVTAFLLIAWSWGVSWTWQLDEVATIFLCVLALIVGVSFVARTDVRADAISAYLYNVSSIIHGPFPSVAHAILHARSGFVRCIYSLHITGCVWYRNQIVMALGGADDSFVFDFTYSSCCWSSLLSQIIGRRP